MAAMLDTGFLYALFDPRDSKHSEAAEKSEEVESLPIAIPWPCLYETMNTRFVKQPARVHAFDSLLKSPRAALIDDTDYRDQAYGLAIESSAARRRPLSLTDMVMRLILDDVNVRIGYLFTFNPGDFADVCRRRSIEML
jgi:predicted nucleic acid-binding protein